MERGWMSTFSGIDLATSAGWRTMDVYISVALGLYICSLSAANVIKLLYRERYSLRQVASDKVPGWLRLNLLVL